MRLFERVDESNAPAADWSNRLQAAGTLIADCGADECDARIDGHPAVAYLGGRDRALAYLHHRWIIYFGVALDEELEQIPSAVIRAAWRAWKHTTRDHRGLARLLSAYANDDAVRGADERHCSLLAGIVAGDPTTLPTFANAGLSTSRRSLPMAG